MGKKLNINVESKNIKTDNDIVKSTLIESTFDYKNVGITEDKDISELIKLEKEIKFHQESWIVPTAYFFAQTDKYFPTGKLNA